MPSSESGLAHLVFFTLKDKSPQARDALVAACHKYLTDHPGVTHFSAGPRAEQYQRPVNDQEFDVALVVVFASAADHDRYQEAPRHKEFIAEQRDNWAAVRVFDALV
ncbi:MAG TPA: Dabb family protein [Lacipirellula sp.]